VNIGQLLTLRLPSGSGGPRRGKDLRELGILEDAAVLCIGGKIVSVGKTKEALRDPWLKKNRKKIVEIRMDEFCVDIILENQIVQEIYQHGNDN